MMSDTYAARDRSAIVINNERFHLRTGSYDQRIWIESRQYLAMAPDPSDVLLDVGANVGAVTRRFLLAGVKYAIAFEPERQNRALLRLNTQEFGARAVVRSEAIAAEAGQRLLWMHKGRNRGLHSLVKRPGRRPTVVSSVSLGSVFHEYSPTLLKIDIEGGEYELLPAFEEIPDQVRAIALEVHLNGNEWRSHLAPHLIEVIRGQGFRDVRSPRIGAGNPCTLAIWRR